MHVFRLGEEYLSRTHASTGRTCTSRFKRWTLLLWGDGANHHCTTMLSSLKKFCVQLFLVSNWASFLILVHLEALPSALHSWSHLDGLNSHNSWRALDWLDMVKAFSFPYHKNNSATMYFQVSFCALQGLCGATVHFIFLFFNCNDAL